MCSKSWLRSLLIYPARLHVTLAISRVMFVLTDIFVSYFCHIKMQGRKKIGAVGVSRVCSSLIPPSCACKLFDHFGFVNFSFCTGPVLSLEECMQFNN